MPIRSVKQLVAEAAAVTEQVSPTDAVMLVGQPDIVFVDVREQSEVDAMGKIAGAMHVPRGLLESKTDPESPTHDPVLSSGKRLVTYCASGARAALAAKTLADMGVTRVAHVHGGGFAALQAAGAATSA